MRSALTKTRSDIPSSVPFSLPSPTGGWNARDPLANMPAEDADIMDNWFPETTDVRTRPGSKYYATGLNGQVETIFAYAKGSSLQLLVLDATTLNLTTITTIQSAGTVNAGSTIAIPTISNARFQYAQIGVAGTSFMVAVNGVDNALIYNGSVAWGQTVFNGGSSPSTVVASNICIYNRRIFYTEANTLRFAYHEQNNAIGGTVTPFDLSGLFGLGGYLMCMDTWTHDSGSGPDDYIAFITSRGEVAVYVGIDPSSANTWSMVGVYRMPAPLSYRSTQKLGGDLLIATESGVIPISAVVNGPLQQEAAVSDKIRNKVTESVKTYRANFGWEVRYYPTGHWLIFNVPIMTGSGQHQYIMNINTGAWCRFKGINANCFAVWDNKLYFGGNGYVGQADVPTGTSNGDLGTDITIDVRQAASVFGLPGRLKHGKQFRPQISSDSDVPIAMGMDWDFSTLVPTNFPSPVTIPFATWDNNLWDTCFWADDPFPQPQWQGIVGLCTYGQVRLSGMINTEDIRWMATDIILEVGEMV